MIVRTDEPIYIHRQTATGVDDYGNPVYSVQEILIRNGLFAYGGGQEPSEVSRNPVSAQLTPYLPYGTTVLDGDKFEIRETMWVKDGSPEEWQAPFPGLTTGVVVRVREWNG